MASQSSPHSTSSLALGCSSPNDWKLRKNIVRSAQGANEMHSRRHSGKSKGNIEFISLLNLFFLFFQSILGGVTSLNQSRTKQIHQSNGSIQSDSPSSNSISPAPSPSPRPQSVNTNNNGGIGFAKRWSSTGDFGTQSSLTGR